MREDKEFTQFWHNNAIGMWERWVPLDIKLGLEVGSFEGASAVWLMDNRPHLKLNCVDVFGQKFDDVTGTYEERFDRNVAEYGNRIKKYKDLSKKVLTGFLEDSFDFIYIDGDHSYEGALSDANLAWPLLKKGGIIIFDDYNNDEFGVRQAVDQFFFGLKRMDYMILREEGDYQMAVKKLA